MFLEAFSTVDWSVSAWFERDLGLITAVAARDFVHLA